MDLVLRPIFLGGVMKASGNKPPMTVAAKGMYMEKDLRRNSDYFGINLKFVEVSQHLECSNQLLLLGFYYVMKCNIHLFLGSL